MTTAAHTSTPRRAYDGVICYGGVDWWYHNRGHYDLQMMREFSAHMPVLYVNSIGMRFPKVGEGAMFIKRMRRKLASLRRGAVTIRPNFTVYSPFTIPGRRAAALSRTLLPMQVTRAARKLGIHRPLVWVACPPAARAVDATHAVGIVYQRTDRFEEFKGVDPAEIGGFDRALKERADLTLYCSHLLMGEEEGQCRHAAFVDHGVDYDIFASAANDAPGTTGNASAGVPADVASIPRPRVGFVGGIDAHTFDPALFVEVARTLPDVQFVLVGACSLPPDWCVLPNVHLMGKRPYEDVARYMAASDVLIMPWNNSEWIRACNPVKLKEYLAVGRPIVSTPFHELRWYEGLVSVAQNAPSFAKAIRDALATPHDPAPGRERVRRATWTAHAADVRDRLAALGLVYEPARSR